MHKDEAGTLLRTIGNLGPRRGWGVSTTPRALYLRETHGTHCKGGLGGPQSRSKRTLKNLANTRIRSPYRNIFFYLS